jgi:hypothetical protein
LGAGFELSAHIEIDPEAAESYAVNFGGDRDAPRALPRDLERCSTEKLVAELGLRTSPEDTFDILAAELPCQAFARIGRSKLRSVSGGKDDAFRKDPRAWPTTHSDVRGGNDDRVDKTKILGKPMFDIFNFAVDEINASGGLLGREIKVISFDTQTTMQFYAQYAQEAALKDKVAVVHGGISSASREVIRPVLDKYKTLHVYDMPYEGGVCGRNIFIDGVTPAQQLRVLIGLWHEELGQEGLHADTVAVCDLKNNPHDARQYVIKAD